MGGGGRYGTKIDTTGIREVYDDRDRKALGMLIDRVIDNVSSLTNLHYILLNNRGFHNC